MKALAWLKPGNDRDLATTVYAGRESATDRASRLNDRRRCPRTVADAARQGEAWEVADRQRERDRSRR